MEKKKKRRKVKVVTKEKKIKEIGKRKSNETRKCNGREGGDVERKKKAMDIIYGYKETKEKERKKRIKMLKKT